MAEIFCKDKYVVNVKCKNCKTAHCFMVKFGKSIKQYCLEFEKLCPNCGCPLLGEKYEITSGVEPVKIKFNK